MARILFHVFNGLAIAAYIAAGRCWDTSGWLLLWVVAGWVANAAAMLAYDYDKEWEAMQ